MNIERASIEDAREILNLQKVAYIAEAEIYNDYTLPPLMQTLEQIEIDFKKQLFFKVSVGERIVGSVRAYLEQETCYIGRLIVSPELQNRGIGMKLMDEVERYFMQAKRFELFTGHRSERNIRLYHKLGYQPFKTEPLDDNITLLYMEKKRND